MGDGFSMGILRVSSELMPGVEETESLTSRIDKLEKAEIEK